jgi:hypothetical protein
MKKERDIITHYITRLKRTKNILVTAIYNMKVTKIVASAALLSIGLLSSNGVIAGQKLPFVGTRYFNFMGGTGTNESITIEKNGTITLKYVDHFSGRHGDPVVLYKGKFSNPIKLKDGTGYLLKGNKIYLLENGKIEKGCITEGEVCEAELSK